MHSRPPISSAASRDIAGEVRMAAILRHLNRRDGVAFPNARFDDLVSLPDSRFGEAGALAQIGDFGRRL
jgi:hypothetical protein